MGRRKGSLNKETLELGQRTRAAIKAGLFSAGVAGRPKGGGRRTGNKPRDKAEVLALMLTDAGENPNAAAIAACTEGAYGHGVISAAEIEVLLMESEPPCELINELCASPPARSDLQDWQHGPDPDIEDDGDPYVRISPVFAPQKGSKATEGRLALKRLGVHIAPHDEREWKGGRNDVDAVAKRIRPIAKQRSARMNLAAAAYCKAVIDFEASLGLPRHEMTLDQHAEMIRRAQAAATAAAHSD